MGKGSIYSYLSPHASPIPTPSLHFLPSRPSRPAPPISLHPFLPLSSFPCLRSHFLALFPDVLLAFLLFQHTDNKFFFRAILTIIVAIIFNTKITCVFTIALLLSSQPSTCSHRHLAHLAEEAEEAEGPQDAELLDPRVAAARSARVLRDGRKVKVGK